MRKKFCWFGKCWHGVVPATICIDMQTPDPPWTNEILILWTDKISWVKCNFLEAVGVISVLPSGCWHFHEIPETVPETECGIQWLPKVDIFVFASYLRLLVKLPLRHFSLHKLSAACCDAALFIGLFFRSETWPQNMSSLTHFCISILYLNIWLFV